MVGVTRANHTGGKATMQATNTVSRRKGRQSKALLAAGTASALVLLGVPLTTAQAAVGGESAAQAVDVAIAGEVLGLLELGLGVSTTGVGSPLSNDTNSDATSLDVAGLGTQLDTGLLTAEATRGADLVSAVSTVEGLDLNLLGADILDVNTITSSVVCPVDGDTVAEATVAGLSVGGQALTVEANASVSSSVDVTVAGLVGAAVTVDVGPVATTSAGGADAAGLVADLTLNATVPITNIAVSVPLGSVVLAQTTCLRPDSADLVAPVITSLDPDQGPTSGGTIVTVEGENFVVGDTLVDVGGVPGEDVEVLSPTELTFVTPVSETSGDVNVTVTTDGGTSGPLAYEYVAPTITSVDPDEGPLDGDQDVTITGTGLTDTADVTIGGVETTGVTIVSATEITLVTPAGAAPGPVDVAVILPGADAALPDGYTYLEDVDAPATIAGLDPDQGPTSGGTLVTITGSGYTQADLGVTFDGTAATDVVVVSDTELVATTPSNEDAGPVEVVVTNEDGASGPAEYNYIAPEVTTVTPNVGPVLGGQGVVITGSGFADDAQVLLGLLPATGVTVVDEGEIQVTTPPGLGVVDVSVVQDGADGVLPDGYTYADVDLTPVATSLDPDQGPTSGGTVVTIEGENFIAGATDVEFGGAAGVDVTVTGPTTLSVTTPEVPTAGSVDVTVTTPEGSSEPLDYEYVAPTLTDVDPNQGPTSGGQDVTLTGTGFTPDSTVTIDGAPAGDVEVVSSTEITLATPAGAAGPADVVVVVPGADAVLEEGYTYTEGEVDLEPVVTSIDPDQGPLSGGQEVTIIGDNFVEGDTDVQLGDNFVTDIDVVSGTTLVITTPAGDAPGVVDVTVTTPNGVNDDLDYEYVAEPDVTSIDPDQGPTTGGTVVVIIGEDFAPDSDVTFEGAPATDVTVVSDTEIRATTPPGAAGPADVSVTGGNGDVTVEDGFTYTVLPSNNGGDDNGGGLINGGNTSTNNGPVRTVGSNNNGSLAYTGTETGMVGLMASILLMAGGALVLSARRRAGTR